MKSKTFFVVSLIVIAIVAVITSLVTISMLKKQVLPAPFGTTGEGKVEVSGTGFTPVVDVIIIDDSVIAQISDIVSFTNILKGVEYTTSLSMIEPKPFVLRNNGNVASNVEVYSTENQLFESASSYVKFWVKQATNSYNQPGWSSLDNCAANGPCYTSSPCTITSADCRDPYYTDCRYTDQISCTANTRCSWSSGNCLLGIPPYRCDFIIPQTQCEASAVCYYSGGIQQCHNCVWNAGVCAESASQCSYGSSACVLPFSSDGSTKASAISGFQYLDIKDEALMYIKIFVGADEGAGTKWTKVKVIGTQA